MRFNFKKIAAIGASVLLAGMTTGFAAAAAYPAPFVQNGVANVAVLYGTGSGVSPLDAAAAGNIQTSLQSYVTSSGGTVSVAGAQALDQGSAARIWLNTSLTNAKQTYLASDFPFLASTTFSGVTTATTTQTIVLGPGTISTSASGNPDNSGKVIFAKMPNSTTDPRIGVSIGTNATYPLYNESVTFSTPINFTTTGNQGVTLNLFGNQYTVSPATTTTSLVLYGSGVPPVTISQGNSTQVTVGGVTYTVTLNAVSSTQAQVSVNGVSGNPLTVGTGTQNINGLNIAVTSVFPSSGVATGSATILVGANQLTLTNGAQVTVGTANTAILGTMVYFSGTTTALSGITISVYAPQVTNSSIVKNSAFVDPVFGTFQITNAGINLPTESSTGRDAITVNAAGLQGMSLGFTDLMNYTTGGLQFAYNASGRVNLTYGASNYYPIYPYEAANLSVLGGLLPVTLTGTGTSGNQEGHILQLTSIYNQPGDSSTNVSNDYVTFVDLLSGNSTTLKGVSLLTGGIASAPLYLDGKTYTVSWENSTWAEMKFTTDSGASSAGVYEIYPAISTANHGQLMLYEPLNLSLSNFDGQANNVTSFNIPNGAGFTTVTFTPTAVTPSGAYNGSNFTISVSSGTGSVSGNGNIYFPNNNSAGLYNLTVVNVTVGKLVYEFIPDLVNVSNKTDIYLITPGTTAAGSTAPLNTTAVVLVEGKDVNSNYNAVVTSLVGGSNSGTSGVGVGSVYFTSTTNYSSFKYSNTNQQQFLDFWGSLITKDSTNSGQPIATISYPMTQIYEQLYLGPSGTSVTTSSGATQLGQIIDTDSHVASYANKNLVVVGGSCINSAAATLVGGAYCGSDWTSATGVGSGSFLIQSFAGSSLTSGVALLVAGYDAPDTQNAATYLTTQKPDTAAGNKWIGTTSTSAQLQVSH